MARFCLIMLMLALVGCNHSKCSDQSAAAPVVQQTPVFAQSPAVVGHSTAMPTQYMPYQQPMMMPQAQPPQQVHALGLGICKIPLPVPKLYSMNTGGQQPIYPIAPIVTNPGVVGQNNGNDELTAILIKMLQEQQNNKGGGGQKDVQAVYERADALEKRLDSMILQFEEIPDKK